MSDKIEVYRHSGGLLFDLPLGPSTNRRTRPVRMGGFAREILTAEARDYLLTVGTQLQWIVRSLKIRPVDRFAYFDLWFILPRRTCDAHNYGKVLFDALEQGGLVADDRFILPRVRGVFHDAQGARAFVLVPQPPPQGEPK